MVLIDKLQYVVHFELNKEQDMCRVIEACDYYFSSELTKEEMAQLIDELTDIYNKMI